MGALLRVKVPSRADHSERSEAQLHEGKRVWERAACGTVRSINHEPMDKNCIEGAINQGKQALALEVGETDE
jgi:hypothetical protein